jgi:hypothetical protein
VHANLLKLWERGIDISANVITSVIVALIGLAFWKAKLWLDLRSDRAKREQQYRMEDERESETRRQEVVNAAAGRKRELDDLADAAQGAGDLASMAIVWQHYEEFMRRNKLNHLPKNLETTAERDKWSVMMRAARNMPGSGPQNKDQMAALIRKTELPANGK